MTRSDQTGAFYLDRHEVKEVHLSAPLENIVSKSDIQDFDTIVLTIHYVRYGRPAHKTLRFPADAMRDDEYENPALKYKRL